MREGGELGLGRGFSDKEAYLKQKDRLSAARMGRRGDEEGLEDVRSGEGGLVRSWRRGGGLGGDMGDEGGRRKRVYG